MGTFEKAMRELVERFLADINARLHALPLGQIGVALERIDGVIGDVVGRQAVRPAREPEKARAVDSVGRTIRVTKKLRDARKLQGSYIGLMRKFPDPVKKRIRAIQRELGVAAAVADMKRRVSGAKAAPTAGKAATARPKRKVPPSYYRCHHRGCTRNWFPLGRPYCGEHAARHR
ncbi:MAG: hypothetical protein QME96_07725 [Myxococcota bacterium]|nr:hypothetical protein [Myxococcota bacterium]